MKIKGFDGYIEVFRGGKQTASNGKEYDGDQLIDNALASFNAADHEPPAVVGHPKDNAPAFGWVEGLKEDVRDGTKILMAKFKQVVPEFEEMVKKGLFKKRSAAFYPDGRLRHVGFLGAAPPAVKGLADIGFSEDDDQVTFEFNESWQLNTIGRVLGSLREFLIEKFSREDADKVISQWEIEDIKQENKTLADEFSDSIDTKGEDAMEFTQEQLDKKIAQAKKDERKRLADEQAKELREKQFSNDLAKVGAFCESMVEKGKIPPAWIDSGLQEFMESQAGSEPIEFSDTKKKTPVEWLMDFFENQVPKVIDFKEVATRDKDLPEVDPEFAECADEERLGLHQKIKALAAKEDISYAEAADRIEE